MNTYVIIDLETTGFGRSAEVIELAALKIVNGKIIDTFESLVKPTVPIPVSVQELTHITNEMVAYAPYIDEILPSFFYFIEDYRLVGHNIIAFDLPILRRLIIDIPDITLNNSYEDTLYMAQHKLELDNYKLSTIASYFGINTDKAHRALQDCYITYECYTKLKSISDLQPPMPTTSTTNNTKPFTSKLTEKTKALQTLNGFIMGIVSDKILVDEEIFALNSWVESHMELAGQYPFDRVFKILDMVLIDGKIEEHERQQLLDFFEEIINPVEKSTPQTNELCFDGKTFCLTGEFNYGDKALVAATLESRGGIIEKSVKRSLDYLIVGNKGSTFWSSEHYGTKVKKAMEYNEKGCHITILKENDIHL